MRRQKTFLSLGISSLLVLGTVLNSSTNISPTIFVAALGQPYNVIISGYIRDPQNIGINGVQVSFSNGGGTDTTDSSGFYSNVVPNGWSGTATPFKDFYDFVPPNRFYNNLTSSLSNQDYIGYRFGDPPSPPTNLQVIKKGPDYVQLQWNDNSNTEDGFIIKSLSIFPVQSLKVDSIPPNTTMSFVVPLKPNTTYVFSVSAFNKFGESTPVQITETTTNTGANESRATNLIALSRSENTIFLTWKDNSTSEAGFRIERKLEGEAWGARNGQLPANSRYHLEHGLLPRTTYLFRIFVRENNAESDPSNEAKATTDSIISIAQHTKGLVVDNRGGGRGWNQFNILGFDQLYDGHLQIWTGGDTVYDGDDGDFTSTTSIKLYDPSGGPANEHTAAASGPLDPVIIRVNSEAIEVHQFTYQNDDKNWTLIEWNVHNVGTKTKKVKLALFLDADAGGDLSDRDLGGFDETRKLVYLENQNSRIHVGLAVVSKTSYFENYQISHFKDQRTPDNSNITGSGETARKELFQGNAFYTKMLYGRMAHEASDLTMTLVSNLGVLDGGNSRKVIYAIAVEESLAELQNCIDNAARFANDYLTGIRDKNIADQPTPNEFSLLPNYPNPFNLGTRLIYQLPKSKKVSLRIMSVLGQEIRTLVEGVKPAGNHEIVWDGRDNQGQRVAGGIYLAQFYAGNFIQTRKLLYLP